MASQQIAADENAARFLLSLGAAAADLWSDLPQWLQYALFERAVVLGHQTERDESLREQLANFCTIITRGPTPVDAMLVVEPADLT